MAEEIVTWINRSRRCAGPVARVFVIVSVMLCAALAVQDGAVAMSESHYDPSACKTDAQGKFYIALGRVVLALPINPPADYRAELYPQDKRIPPPDPFDKEGCPSNPLQLSGYGFPYYLFPISVVAPLVDNEKLSADQVLGIRFLQLIRTFHGDGVPSEHDPIWIREDLQIMRASDACDAAFLREDLPNGLTACRVKPVIEMDQRDWGTSYIAREDVYRTPLGRKFIVDCGALVFTSGVYPCDVGYVAAPGLGLTYDFEPYRGPRIIPIEKIIEFDKGLRAAIEAATVKDYQWGK